jgi:excinuclease UvrABC nuclease subunit
VPGIGPLTRKKLIRHFGSARAALNADAAQLQTLLGAKRGQQVARYFSQLR